MKPLLLSQLQRSIRTLPGIGPKTATALERLCEGESIFNLLLHHPIDGIDRSYTAPIAQLTPGRVATIQVHVKKFTPSHKRGLPHRIVVGDDCNDMTLVYFKGHRQWIEDTYVQGAELIISGMVEAYQSGLQMVHPDYALPITKKDEIPALQPIYPLTQGVTGKTFIKAVTSALSSLPDLPEWIEPSLMAQQKWPSWSQAITALHQPATMQDLDHHQPHRRRLAYDELLASQLAVAIMKAYHKRQKGQIFDANPDMRARALSLLPYTLTSAQMRCMHDIDADMQSNAKMLRLIQGDVGSGKTVLALLAGLNAITCGKQASLMAPTEILAKQHYDGLLPLLQQLDITSVLLTGGDKGKLRKEKLTQIADGTAQFVIGTHALFQDSITFHDLGLAVVDEQHRFGVHQRLALSNKHPYADMLVMTATPIPRTLSLAAFGHMDISRLDEKPPGRKDIDTRLFSAERIGDIIEGLKRKITSGEQAYWVCPLVEETEKSDMAAAEERAVLLRHIFGNKVAVIHGRMKGGEKDEIMRRFTANEVQILVATTVIEVGVNVPNASVMIIEHAERFGLAQLHQLRGRVGRGDQDSACLLMYHGQLSETAKERLQVMRRSNDGFVIAEKDLELRGAGEVLGTRQSGLPKFRLADLTQDQDLLTMATQDAQLLVESDARLVSKRGEAAKHLLYLFEKDSAIQTVRSG